MIEQSYSDEPNQIEQTLVINEKSENLPQQTMENYIQDKELLYNAILEFIDYPNDNSNNSGSELCFYSLTKIIKNQQIEKDREEMQEFLQIIKSIIDNHHRDNNFLPKLEKIFQYYKNQIKQTLSNIEIYHIFESNKKVLLYLLQNNIVTITDSIYSEMINKVESNGNRYCYFFYPEIENFVGEEKMKDVKNELLSKDPNFFDNYQYKRKEGENDTYICSLIRKDSVEEFISYVTRMNLVLSSKIEPSIYETHSFLIENNKTTLFEYSAFFGSIQICQYLQMSNVKPKPSLWLYSIHSNSPELIHFLEYLNVEPPRLSGSKKNNDKNDDYSRCFSEAIKCHHNEIAFYITNNFLTQKEGNDDSKQKEEMILNSIKYHNYCHFSSEIVCEIGFFYLCLYGYHKLVNLLLKKKEKEIESKIILKIFFILFQINFFLNEILNIIFCLIKQQFKWQLIIMTLKLSIICYPKRKKSRKIFSVKIK
ncbi:hypothetical protein M9Y10_025150 [Tritrichomonas musculus]|uniref:DUF3447 domain-containing protein n=1 Tax=Tritrichomonas musculus TaxID=1915356 RepID=A0ABR2HAP1_9EUKA